MENKGRKIIPLECSVCGNRNYRIIRSREVVARARLEASKYCKFCKKHTKHVEAR